MTPPTELERLRAENERLNRHVAAIVTERTSLLGIKVLRERERAEAWKAAAEASESMPSEPGYGDPFGTEQYGDASDHTEALFEAARKLEEPSDVD